MTADKMIGLGRAPEATLMYREAGEGGAAVARFLAANGPAIARIGDRLRSDPPAAIVTCARGSSDHAATYAKYVFETLAGVVTASDALSVASVYSAPGLPANLLCIAISQSGRSPDLIAAVEARKASGAFVVALINQPSSPLAALADEVLLLEAGPEQSVAATKSFIASLAGVAAIAAAWTRDDDLAAAVAALPDQLPRAFALDWSAAIPAFADASSMFVVGRGYGLGVAQEAALKLKETCGLHAEAFSAAEVKHGPMAIVGEGFPILAFAGSDDAGRDVRETADLFRARGAEIRIADTGGGAGSLPAIASHPVIEPILLIQAFYRMANSLSIARGRDPDRPPFLSKVTRTR